MFTVCSQPNLKGNLYTQVENSGWLSLVRKILSNAKDIAVVMDNHEKNVLVHCSDGWDRTAELCTLVQLLIDPFYRTFKGFQILIEKDWISYGHMFEKRLGHFADDKKEKDQR